MSVGSVRCVSGRRQANSYTAHAKPEGTGSVGHVAVAAVEVQEFLNDYNDPIALIEPNDPTAPIVTYVAYVPDYIIRVAKPRCGQEDVSLILRLSGVDWYAENTTVYAVVHYPTSTCTVETS